MGFLAPEPSFAINEITFDVVQNHRGQILHNRFKKFFIVPANYCYQFFYPNQQFFNMPMQNEVYCQFPYSNMQNFSSNKNINSKNYYNDKNNNNNINNYNNNYNFNNINNYNNNSNFNNINNYNFNNNINNYNVYNNNFNNNNTYQKSEHLRGLVNIASTCYMNATLQCFAHIKELFVYFQKPKIQSLMDLPESDSKLFPVFAELINCMYDPYDPSPLYPYIFKEKLGQLNPLFQGPIPNDAKDLLTFMLMQLHDELNHPTNNNNNNQNMIIDSYIQKDKKVMFKNFVTFFKNNYKSIISELFYGLTYNQTQCQICHTTIYNYQTFNFLIFPLAQVLNHKMQSVNFQNNFENKVTLDECFQFNQITTPLNDYYCNFCRQTSIGMYANFISVLPNIIIIILNRGAGLEHDVKIEFEENLDLKNYVEYLKESSFYELIGVVTHYGESGASGHFMARCKSPVCEDWYLYNDAIVQKIGFFNKEEFFGGHPYILFYKKTKFGNK